MRIAKEGWPFILPGTFLTAAAGVLAVVVDRIWVVPFAVLLVLLLWVTAFFRDPVRSGPTGAGLVIAPADGKIVSIQEVVEPQFIEGRALRISIFMNVFNVHVNRYPVSGTVEYRSYHPGRFFNASLDKASEHNERMSLGIQSGGRRFLVTQIAGLVARRIVTDATVGDPARQGARLGLIRFGSRVDTFVPIDSTVTVAVGDRTRAGVSILAELEE